MQRPSPERVAEIVEPLLRTARIPGIGIAVVCAGTVVLATGYGYRDLAAKLPVTAQTLYPIASTTKAMNATLLGLLADDGMLEWDAPVRRYLADFSLGDACRSANVTLRDLVTMRTGLPPHDWMWLESRIDRAELVHRLRFLAPVAGLRERFQYNNLTVTAAGHIAELVCAESWGRLMATRLFDPLAMKSTVVGRPAQGNITLAYFENGHRELEVTQPLFGEVTAPSGGAVYSTLEDMTRWMLFNLDSGRARERQLIQPATLQEIGSPQIVVPPASAPELTVQPCYAMGWYVDNYWGHRRLLHGGYHHDVNSDVMLLPDDGVGIVSFTNFGFPRLARFLNQSVLDLVMGVTHERTLSGKLAEYERKIEETARRNAAARFVSGTVPSHSIEDYTGRFTHPAYGTIEIERGEGGLALRRHDLFLSLRHRHYDAWVAVDADRFGIHIPQPFERASALLFETNGEGEIAAFTLKFELLADAVRFAKQGVRA
jgi:CubicO group peptidase (beta-lactamase class C family)